MNIRLFLVVLFGFGFFLHLAFAGAVLGSSGVIDFHGSRTQGGLTHDLGTGELALHSASSGLSDDEEYCLSSYDDNYGPACLEEYGFSDQDLWKACIDDFSPSYLYYGAEDCLSDSRHYTGISQDAEDATQEIATSYQTQCLLDHWDEYGDECTRTAEGEADTQEAMAEFCAVEDPGFDEDCIDTYQDQYLGSCVVDLANLGVGFEDGPIDCVKSEGDRYYEDCLLAYGAEESHTYSQSYADQCMEDHPEVSASTAEVQDCLDANQDYFAADCLRVYGDDYADACVDDNKDDVEQYCLEEEGKGYWGDCLAAHGSDYGCEVDSSDTLKSDCLDDHGDTYGGDCLDENADVYGRDCLSANTEAYAEDCIASGFDNYCDTQDYRESVLNDHLQEAGDYCQDSGLIEDYYQVCIGDTGFVTGEECVVTFIDDYLEDCSADNQDDADEACQIEHECSVSSDSVYYCDGNYNEPLSGTCYEEYSDEAVDYYGEQCIQDHGSDYEEECLSNNADFLADEYGQDCIDRNQDYLGDCFADNEDEISDYLWGEYSYEAFDSCVSEQGEVCIGDNEDDYADQCLQDNEDDYADQCLQDNMGAVGSLCLEDYGDDYYGQCVEDYGGKCLDDNVQEIGESCVSDNENVMGDYCIQGYGDAYGSECVQDHLGDYETRCEEDIASGNSFTGFASISECSDGIDNDNDGFVDIEDTACLDSEDDSEEGFGHQLGVVTELSDDQRTCLDYAVTEKEDTYHFAESCLEAHASDMAWELGWACESSGGLCVAEHDRSDYEEACDSWYYTPEKCLEEGYTDLDACWAALDCIDQWDDYSVFKLLEADCKYSEYGFYADDLDTCWQTNEKDAELSAGLECVQTFGTTLEYENTGQSLVDYCTAAVAVPEGYGEETGVAFRPSLTGNRFAAPEREGFFQGVWHFFIGGSGGGQILQQSGTA